MLFAFVSDLLLPSLLSFLLDSIVFGLLVFHLYVCLVFHFASKTSCLLLLFHFCFLQETLSSTFLLGRPKSTVADVKPFILFAYFSTVSLQDTKLCSRLWGQCDRNSDFTEGPDPCVVPTAHTTCRT